MSDISNTVSASRQSRAIPLVLLIVGALLLAFGTAAVTHRNYDTVNFGRGHFDCRIAGRYSFVPQDEYANEIFGFSMTNVQVAEANAYCAANPPHWWNS